MRQNVKMIIAGPFFVIIENALFLAADLFDASDIQDRIHAKLFHLPEGQISLKKALARASAFFCDVCPI